METSESEEVGQDLDVPVHERCSYRVGGGLPDSSLASRLELASHVRNGTPRHEPVCRAAAGRAPWTTTLTGAAVGMSVWTR